MPLQSSEKLSNMYCWTARPIASSPMSTYEQTKMQSSYSHNKHMSDAYIQNNQL